MTDDIHNAWVKHRYFAPDSDIPECWDAGCSCGWAGVDFDTLDDVNVAVEIHLLGRPA